MGEPAAFRRAAATMTATAQDARRLSSESARLVRMIGTRAPSTIPAASAPGEERQALGEHIASFEVGNDEHVRTSGDGGYDLLDRRRLRTDRVVERERPIEQRPGYLTALRHFA